MCQSVKSVKLKKKKMNQAKYHLSTSPKKYECPGCGKRSFTYYVDTVNQVAGSAYGYCDRKDKCGYNEYPPRGLSTKENESWMESEEYKKQLFPDQSRIDFIPIEKVIPTLKLLEKNNLIRFLVATFEKDAALDVARKYRIGTSKKWVSDGGYATVFWQIDKELNVRQGKIMAYNPLTGRRIKNSDGRGKIFFKGKELLGESANLVQCFFGEHLLDSDMEKPVCIVESEKTALVMAITTPECIWLATGGSSGAGWTKDQVYCALKDRQVVLFPDLGQYGAWLDKSKILNTVCRHVEVSNFIEIRATCEDRKSGLDIADFILRSYNPRNLDPLENKVEQLPEGWYRDEDGGLRDTNDLTIEWWTDADLADTDRSNDLIRQIVVKERERLRC